MRPYITATGMAFGLLVMWMALVQFMLWPELSETKMRTLALVHFSGLSKPGIGLPAAACVTMLPAMFLVSEADAAAIRTAYERA
jgi:hypothetical protein